MHYFRWYRTGDPLKTNSRANGATALRDEHGNKECNRCGQWLPVSSFRKHVGAADNLHSACALCQNTRIFGITRNEFEAMLARQGGLCAICKSEPVKRRFAIDHDHTHCAKKGGCPECIRGILCNGCNTGLGFFKDSEARLQSAIDYLRSHSI